MNIAPAGREFRRTLALAFAAGIGLRLLFLPYAGFPGDTVQPLRWMRAAADRGVVSVYDPQYALDCNYPPTFIYILTGLGEIDQRLPWLRLYPKLESALVGLPGMLADLAVAALLVWWVRRRYSERAALWTGAALLLNPALIHLSAFWGQTDALGLLPLLAGLLAIEAGGFALAGALLAIALWTKFQGIIFIPLAALMLLRHGRVRGTAQAVVAAVLVSVAWILPFLIAGNPHLSRMLHAAYGGNVGLFPGLTLNAANLWALHPQPGTHDFLLPTFLYGGDGRVHVGGLLALLSWRNLSLALFGAAMLGILAWFWRMGRWTAAALLSTLAFFALPTEMHERYLYPAIPLLALLVARGRAPAWLFWTLSVLFWTGLAATAPPVGVIPPLALPMLFLLALVALTVLRPDERTWPVRVGEMRGGTFALLVLLPLLLPPVFLFAWKQSDTPDVVYLDEIEWTVQRADWRPPHRAETIERRPLQIGEYRYRHGVGVHAHSEIVLVAPPRAVAFAAEVGLDAEALDDPRSSVRFRILAGERILWESPIFAGGEEPHAMRVDVTPGERLRFIVDGLESINGDHADWANARFELRHGEE